MYPVQAISAIAHETCKLVEACFFMCVKPSPENIETGLTPYIHPSCPTDESSALNRVYPGVCDDNSSSLLIPAVLIVGAGLLLTGTVVSLVKGYISPRRENQNRYDPRREYRIIRED